jgi:hypothetical protein
MRTPSFFHTTATIRHNKNSIMVLKDGDGIDKFNHEDKAQLPWEAFKERLGTSEFTQMHFDLSVFINTSARLHGLILPFWKEETDNIVSSLPNGKSPGPDGFNTEFLKKCWPVIKEEFYGMCFAFFDHSLCIQSINGSHITLIPMVPNPSKVSDFRAISLLNSYIKLITKIQANRLQKVILQVIHQNQYGFLKSRSIQDCLAWSFEYLHLCHKYKKQMVLLKLDFEKAFDKVEHEVIVQVMEHKGFPNKWIQWIKGILGSATSSILLNGTTGKVFHYRRGV